jgi:hypothetical protein
MSAYDIMMPVDGGRWSDTLMAAQRWSQAHPVSQPDPRAAPDWTAHLSAAKAEWSWFLEQNPDMDAYHQLYGYTDGTVTGGACPPRAKAKTKAKAKAKARTL